MDELATKINFREADFFYNHPNALVDYGQMAGFSLIKSCIEVFAYYEVWDLTPEDIQQFFETINLIQKKFNRPFHPSTKRIAMVLDCCLTEGENYLTCQNGTYHIVHWNTDGYHFELQRAYEEHLLPEASQTS